MSAAMLLRRQGLALGASNRSSPRRSGAAVRHPKPFTPARKFLASRAQPEDAEDAATEAAVLLEGEQLGEDVNVEALVMEDAEEETTETDGGDLKAAIKVAQEFTTAYEDHLLIEATLRSELAAAGDEEDEVEGLPEPEAEDSQGTVADEEDDDVVEGASESAFERLLVSATGTAQDEDTLMAFVGSESPAALEDVQDVQGPRGFRKYDEQEHSGVSEEERASMVDTKLSKEELASLVPEDWDTINIDWFSNKKEDNIALPEYRLNFIWTERNIAVAVDQVYSRGQVSPLTEYFFWPRKDAWDELRMALEARPWIPERDKIILLNRTTEVINTWQAEGDTRPTLDVVRAEFPDCSFMGTSTPPPPPPPAYNPEMAMTA